MTDLPILFKAAMVNALRAGRKTQTRRLLSPDWLRIADSYGTFRRPPPVVFDHATETALNFRKIDGIWTWETDPTPGSNAVKTVWTGRTKVNSGDTLWVKETWRTESRAYDDLAPSEMGGDETILYDADGNWSANKSTGKTRVSIHMPRWASRLTLTVTDVRIERLLDLSKEDAIAEGLIKLPATGRYVVNKGDQYFGLAEFDPIKVYFSLWDRINDHGPGSPIAVTNPWVIAITFTVSERNSP